MFHENLRLSFDYRLAQIYDRILLFFCFWSSLILLYKVYLKKVLLCVHVFLHSQVIEFHLNGFYYVHMYVYTHGSQNFT